MREGLSSGHFSVDGQLEDAVSYLEHNEGAMVRECRRVVEVQHERARVMSARRETRVVVDVDRAERRNGSRNGNPCYAIITTDDRTYVTATDSRCAYGVTNMFGRASRTGTRGITLVLTPAGRVVDIVKVTEVRP